jgi:predicted RNase H-like nuclease (RuvC/YqgF family)
LKNEKASLLESMDSNHEAYQKQISELESNLKKVTEYNQNLGEKCVGLKFKMEAYEQELLGLKNLKSQILKDCNIQETNFKEKIRLYENLVEKQQEKIELLEERTKGIKKYNHLTSWGDGVEEKKVSKEFSLLWGVIKIKR